MRTALAIAAAVGLVVLFTLTFVWQTRLERGLPPRVECADQIEAFNQAAAWVKAHGGEWRWILGTGSMAPYIPHAGDGLDPQATIVAFAITKPGATFDGIEPGDLCLYAAAWDPKLSVIHSAAARDGDGWIMTGLANKHYEHAWRVTRSNFHGKAAAVFTWPQIPNSPPQ